MIRTALFNWAFARHHQGTLVFRIEGHRRGPRLEESYGQLLDAMRWLGLDWTRARGGRPVRALRQSQRMDIYADVARPPQGGPGTRTTATAPPRSWRSAGPKTRAAGRPSGYDGNCRTLTADQVAAYQAEGRTSIVRFRMPDEPITFTDLVRGELRPYVTGRSAAGVGGQQAPSPAQHMGDPHQRVGRPG